MLNWYDSKNVKTANTDEKYRNEKTMTNCWLWWRNDENGSQSQQPITEDTVNVSSEQQ